MCISFFAIQAEAFILGRYEDKSGGIAEEPAAPDNTYERLELAQAERQIIHCIEHLPRQQRHVLLAHYFQRQLFEDIAADMGVSKGRVCHLHHAALKRMRSALEPYFGRPDL